ncbi:MAG: type III pantothenate kinase [Cyanobium sp.]
MAGTHRWLLIGNSRWHWAETGAAGLCIEHRDAALARRDALIADPWAWAAVGVLPPGREPEASRRVGTADVPLEGAPAWLGVDRALAGWMAWRNWRQDVLVADAGTVLSFTCVDRQGRFVGGRLIAGLALQLRAMAQGTATLPWPQGPEGEGERWGDGGWPTDTAGAMAVGVRRALAAAVVSAIAERREHDRHCALVLTGGDARNLLPLVQPLVVAEGGSVIHEPDLALRGLVALRPADDAAVQSSPRSVSS